MARFTPENLQRAHDLNGLYPKQRSALIPLLHLAQEQEGWLNGEIMRHVAELVDLTPAEVLGVASFYDMLFTEEVGTHLVSICTNLACMLNGGEALLAHAEEQLKTKAGSSTPDGQFTLEEVECLGRCDKAPCLTVNWRYFDEVSNADFDKLVQDLRAGNLRADVPAHGTLNRVRRQVGLVNSGPGTPVSINASNGALDWGPTKFTRPVTDPTRTSSTTIRRVRAGVTEGDSA